MYVPKDLVPLLRQGLQNGRRLEQLLFALGPAFASRPPSRTTQTGLSLHRLHYCRDCLGEAAGD